MGKSRKNAVPTSRVPIFFKHRARFASKAVYLSSKSKDMEENKQLDFSSETLTVKVLRIFNP